jgi:tRNA (mo5U34)-methyltransferase
MPISTKPNQCSSPRSITDDPSRIANQSDDSEFFNWPDLDKLISCDQLVLRQRVAQVPKWFHKIDLGRGVVTPGTIDAASKLPRLHLPENLAEKTVLDVGAWDGFYSFECARRGADVTAIDLWHPDHNATSEGFAVARAALGLPVRAMRGSVFDLNSRRVEPRDLVLFLGVLYHLEDPLGALRQLRCVTRELLILETATDFNLIRRPAVAFYPEGERAIDHSNWFAPNAAALKGMLQAAGFRDVSVVHSLGLLSRAARAVSHKQRFNESLLHGLSRGRIVVHARP